MRSVIFIFSALSLFLLVKKTVLSLKGGSETRFSLKFTAETLFSRQLLDFIARALFSLYCEM